MSLKYVGCVCLGFTGLFGFGLQDLWGQKPGTCVRVLRFVEIKPVDMDPEWEDPSPVPVLQIKIFLTSSKKNGLNVSQVDFAGLPFGGRCDPFSVADSWNPRPTWSRVLVFAAWGSLCYHVRSIKGRPLCGLHC